MIGAAPGHASPLANLVKSNVLLPKRRALAGNLPRDPRGPVGGGRFDDDTANTVGTGPFLEGKKPQRRCGVYGPAARVPNVGSPRRSSSSRARDITSTHASKHTVARPSGPGQGWAVAVRSGRATWEQPVSICPLLQANDARLTRHHDKLYPSVHLAVSGRRRVGRAKAPHNPLYEVLCYQVFAVGGPFMSGHGRPLASGGEARPRRLLEVDGARGAHQPAQAASATQAMPSRWVFAPFRVQVECPSQMFFSSCQTQAASAPAY